jgi:alpha-beta hydrolase superfamily lysophospholipase
LFEAAAFRDLGYNVLLIDFRAHGQSAGNNSSFGIDETEEVKNAFEFARRKGNKKIILYGMSLGAVVCIKAASEKAVQPDAIIAEMPFGSLQDHIRARAQSVGFSNAAGPFSFFVTFWIGLERGFNGFNHKTTDYAKQVNCPVLLQSGQNDLYVTESQIMSVYKSIGSNKKLVTYPEAGHESLLRADVTRWMNEVDQFLTSLP